MRRQSAQEFAVHDEAEWRAEDGPESPSLRSLEGLVALRRFRRRLEETFRFDEDVLDGLFLDAEIEVAGPTGFAPTVAQFETACLKLAEYRYYKERGNSLFRAVKNQHNVWPPEDERDEIGTKSLRAAVRTYDPEKGAALFTYWVIICKNLTISRHGRGTANLAWVPIDEARDAAKRRSATMEDLIVAIAAAIRSLPAGEDADTLREWARAGFSYTDMARNLGLKAASTALRRVDRAWPSIKDQLYSVDPPGSFMLMRKHEIPPTATVLKPMKATVLIFLPDEESS